MINLDVEIYIKLRASSLYFAKLMFGLSPQPVKPEYKAIWQLGLLMTGDAWQSFCDGVQPYWFDSYEDGKHLSWQQSLVLYGVDKSITEDALDRVSIVSGHGIGKSALLSMIILWFLFIHPACQVACTAPTATQMNDVLWKELKKWIDRMPKEIGALYEWQNSYIRMREDPETWFARAKTSTKENTEALAGVHGDWVLIAVDEASGVEEPIFNTMEGALTGGKTIVFLISNGTRTMGYFYDTHHNDKARWQRYSFNSEDSPRVDSKFVDGIISKHGKDSTEYRIRVAGKFPEEGVMEDGGWTTLFNESDLHFVPFDPRWEPVGRSIMALDPAGEGQDTAEFAVRDRLRLAIVASEKSSNSKGLALKGITLAEKYYVDASDWVVDAFGVGHDIGQEVALATSTKEPPWRLWPINSGEQCEDIYDKELYLNKRAEAFYKMRNWCRAGGELMDSPGFKQELLSIRMKRTASGKIQIMDKVTARKLGIPSPNKADAASYTFLRNDVGVRSDHGWILPKFVDNFDKFDPVGD